MKSLYTQLKNPNALRQGSTWSYKWAMETIWTVKNVLEETTNSYIVDLICEQNKDWGNFPNQCIRKDQIIVVKY